MTIPRDCNGTALLPGMRVRLTGVVLSAPDPFDVFVVPDNQRGKDEQVIPSLRAKVLEVVDGNED